jgi:hypothetical protein
MWLMPDFEALSFLVIVALIGADACGGGMSADDPEALALYREEMTAPVRTNQYTKEGTNLVSTPYPSTATAAPTLSTGFKAQRQPHCVRRAASTISMFADLSPRSSSETTVTTAGAVSPGPMPRPQIRLMSSSVYSSTLVDPFAPKTTT